MSFRRAGRGRRIGWIALLAGLTAVAFGVANGYAGAPAAGQRLRCPGDQVGILNILYDAEYVEARSPEQQIDQMIGDLHIGGLSEISRPEVTSVHESNVRRELAVQNSAGHTAALFTFENRGQRGWQLDHVARCP